MQAADGDPLAPVFHRVEIAWSRFRNLRYILTASKVSKKSQTTSFFKPQWYQPCYTALNLGKMTEKVKRKT